MFFPFVHLHELTLLPGRYTPISEEEYNQDIFALFYDHNMSAAQDPLESHKLGLLFLVFAMGKLMDIRGREILIQEATRYYQIGRAALTINSVLESRSIPALQALVSLQSVVMSLIH